MCLVVVLAGCTGLGGLGGSGNDESTTASNADSGSGSGSGSGGDSGDASTQSGSDDSTAANSGASSGSDGGSSSDAETASSDSSGGDSSDSSGGDAGSSSGSLDAEEEWFNLSKPGRYVFEIESAEEGTGQMAFEVTNVENGQATVKTSYELGGESSESSVTGPVGEVEPQLVMSPVYGYLLAIQLGGIGAGAVGGGDQLQVGDKFAQQSAEGSVNIEVIGTDSYAGVDCYVVETRINGTVSQEVCTQQAFSSAPYVAIYDENGTLSERVELVEYERN